MKRKRQAGYAIILTTIALVALLAFMGFGIDMGMLRYERRLQQTAADAAAIAGTNDLADICLGVSAGCASRDTAAQNAATANGFTDGSNNVTVAVNNPPSYWAGDPHLGDAKYVEVVITAVHQTYFERIVGIENETVVARAEATWNAGGANSSNCLVTLGDPSNEIGVDVIGSVTLNATTCGIVDNGNFTPTGNGMTVNTCSFNVGGPGDAGNSSGNVTCNGNTLTPSYNTPTTENPLFKLNSQTPCGFATCNPASSPASPNTSGCNGATYCCPGGATVCSFQSVSINGGTVTFAPGVYIIDGGGTTNNPGFNCTGDPNISGNGVMFFFTGAATITCTGSGTMNLTAPGVNGASGVPANLPQDWNGVLMWQDPADTSTGNLTAKGSSCTGGKGNNLGPSLGGDTGGNSTTNGFNGALYFPADQLWFYGNTHGGVNYLNVAAAVSDSLCMSGNADINFVGLTGPGVGPLLSTLSNAVLVE
jgi:hypothetical protein